jgi:hypothetical protein
MMELRLATPDHSILLPSYRAVLQRCIQHGMGQTKKIIDTLEHGKNPNFLLVVVLSGVALIGLLIVAWLLVGDQGRKLLPGLHHDPQPTSSTRRQATGTVAA